MNCFTCRIVLKNCLTQKVVCCCYSMDITSQMKIELNRHTNQFMNAYQKCFSNNTVIELIFELTSSIGIT